MGLELLPKVGDGALLSSHMHYLNDGAVEFAFTDQVNQWVVGLWGFWLGHADDRSATVETLSLALSSSANNEVVTVDIDATLSDGHGHELDRDSSWVIPVCLALTGSSDQLSYLQDLGGEIAAGHSMQVQMPSHPPFAIAQSVLAGFSLSYEKNKSVLGLSAGCDLTYGQGTGMVAAQASMYDADTNRAQDAGVYAGYIALHYSLGLTVTEIAEQSFGPVTVPVTGPFSQVAVMLSDFEVQYPGRDDHWVSHVSTWAIGRTWSGIELTEIPITFDAGSVTLSALGATIGDDTHHVQDDTQSKVSALLLAL